MNILISLDDDQNILFSKDIKFFDTLLLGIL